jgi:hypothetical protein
MREMILLALGVVAIVGLMYVLLTKHMPMQARFASEVTKVETQKGSSPEADSQKKRQARRARPSDSTEDLPDIRVEILESTPQTAGLLAGNVLPATFPEPRDFRSGMLRAEVEQRYGTPTLSTVQTRSGRLLQRYVYVKGDKTAVTVAVLEDGRVVNALSMPQ